MDKRRREWLVGLSLIGVGLAGFYLWPVPKVPFRDLYSKVNPATAQSLAEFRRAYRLKRLRVGDEEWEYIVVGKGTETILFLHGMTGAYDIWWQQIEALKDRYRILSVTYPPARNLQEVQSGLTAIVGTSLGGYITQYLLVHPPVRIQRAVLSNTFPPNDLIAEKNRHLGALLPWLPEWLVMRFMRRNFEQVIYPTSGHDALTLAYLNEMGYGRMRKKHVIRRYQCVIEKFSPKSPAIPLLIIESENDPLVEASPRQQLKATYPSAKVYTFSDAGHFPYLNRPNDYTRVLEAFLKN